MVHFDNLKVGTRVQTNRDGEIFQGTVRFKGGLISREGNWVGVELDKPAGYTSGLIKGHRYFQCNAKHGIFIRPRKLHLIGNWRTMSGNSYRTINKESYVDDTLFAKKPAGINNEQRQWQGYNNGNKTIAAVTPEYISSSKRAFSVPLTSHCQMERRINFHKKHSVGHTVSPAATTKDKIRNSHRSSRCSERTFIPTSPSIPDYHLPRKVLKRMVQKEYFGTSIPKQNTLY
ncbi:uncharacterized protein LOC114524190 [Dendronephthya gigantea]|uniref:uncharacterized protein LOC114524190 n=1 Tax=Dendronephthya gigantea TaxID=151771 RepID=UPI001068D361|nr:uncharacterized protein LOC114524190 [Dendronephthya gigantea]